MACGENTSVNQLYKILSEILKREASVKYGPERKGDIKNSLADIRDTKEQLGYNPQYKIEEGLEKTVEWYVKNLNLEV